VNPVIAIDGAAGSGKSTLARLLARELSLPYVNTGLMYRALTRLALDSGASLDDGPALAALIDRLTFSLSEGDLPELEVEGYARDELESLEVDSTVSAVARHPEVRERLRALQRGIGEWKGAVMEGRDIGSVVFLDAEVKIFLTASIDERARRRTAQLELDPEKLEKIKTAISRRDEVDSTRDESPLTIASEAIEVDTTGRTVDEVVEEIATLVSGP
jgi:cytidylate kinase